MADLNKIFLYRMSHIENIPHILQYGITHIGSSNANSKYMSIGDGGLITTRHFHPMPNGSYLGDYIPFYFGPRMPMLFVIQKGHNGLQSTLPENIVYCVTSIAKIIEQQLDFIFTDGHAVDKFSTFYSSDEVNHIDNYLDWKAIGSKYWKNDADLDFKRKKEAEFLVKNDIPLNIIIGYVVYQQKGKATLEKMGVTARILVKPDYYF